MYVSFVALVTLRALLNLQSAHCGRCEKEEAKNEIHPDHRKRAGKDCTRKSHRGYSFFYSPSKRSISAGSVVGS